MKKIFAVSYLQFVLGVVFIAATFALTFYVDIVAKLTGQENISESILRQTLGDQISDFSGIGTVNTVVIVLFWSAVGLAAYTAVWSMASSYINARNGVKVEQEYTNRGDIKERMRVPLLRAGIIIGLIILLIVTLQSLWPSWLGMFGQFLTTVSTDVVAALGYFVAAFVGALLNLYVFKVGISAARALK